MQNDDQLQQQATRFKELYHGTREAIGKTMVGRTASSRGF